MSTNDPFIRYLYSLKHEDTGTLAALRRACGQRLAESRNCQHFASVSTCPADFLTVTLVTQYSSDSVRKGQHNKQYPNRGSIGAAWAAYCRSRKREDDPHTFYKNRQEVISRGQNAPRPPSIHERFRTLLDAGMELNGTGELAYRLRGLVRMLVAEGIPIDVIQLAWDLRQWRAESRCVQERWAKAFYAPVDFKKTEGQDSNEIEQDESESEPENEEDEHVD